MSETEYALGFHCGITFAGLKAASLFWIRRDQTAALRYYARCFAGKDFRFTVLREQDEKLLIYVFHRPRLRAILEDGANRRFLSGCGYEYSDIESAVDELKKRLEGEEKFPHEIGIFLGYPLEDVAGFMRDPCKGVCLSGYWKVYADPDGKAKIFERYRRCSCCICRKLTEGTPLTAIFKTETSKKEDSEDDHDRVLVGNG